MLKFFEFTIGSFAALFPVADPLGAVPLFLILSAGESPKRQNQLSLRIAVYTVLTLGTFLLIGGSVLNFFGISIAVVKIAGGIVVFEAGWQALNQKPKIQEKEEEEAVTKIERHQDISFIPMTIPLLAGPGSIAVTLGLAAQAGKGLSLNLLAIFLAIVIIGFISYVCLRLSTMFLKLLGETGITAISRLLGLFILAVGVQLILNGLADWLVHLDKTTATALMQLFSS